MTIQILGTGCPKCRALEESARTAAQLAGVSADIVKVTDVDRIMEMGVMMTPAIAVDGVVKESGRVLRPEEIVPFLRPAD